MIVLAQKIVREREAELLKWLKAQYRDTMTHKLKAVANKNYGEAHYAEGMAAAYAFAIIYFKRTMLPPRRRR